jgi:GT2 family glycosyltransferase
MTGGGITVAVATCGRPEGLKRCLSALAVQTHPAAAVIVVDQASAAGARHAVEASEVERVTYLEQERLGLSASRNLALRSAASEYLAVTDDDCMPDPEWLATIVAAFERAPRPAAVTGRILPLGEAPPDSFAISLRKETSPVDYEARVFPWGVGSGGNFAAPVRALLDLSGWDERLGAGSPGKAGEDCDLLDRLLDQGALVRYEPGAVVRHDWQTRDRRLETRWTYGYGIGAMCGLRLAQRDGFGARMLIGYERLHVRPLLGALRHRDGFAARERTRAIASVLPGALYGYRSGRAAARRVKR